MWSKSNIKKAVLVAAIIFVLFITGPTIKVDQNIKPVLLPHDVENYINNQEETCCEDIKPSANKTIFWAHPDQRTTAYSLVYLHGFTASRREIAPVCQQVAERISANIYYARFKGHGRKCFKATKTVRTEHWLNETAEAVEIGRNIGNKVVIIASSTGAGLGIYETARKADNIKAIVMISPNFEPKDKNSLLMLLPWGKQLTLLFKGTTIDNTHPDLSQIEKEIWTHKYSTKFLFPMIGVVKLLKKVELDSIKIPALVIYSTRDMVADQKLTLKRLQDWGGIAQLLEITDSENPEQHIITGDVGDPKTTDRVVNEIVDFILHLN